MKNKNLQTRCLGNWVLDTELASIWQAVEKLQPILQDYINKNEQKEQTLNKIDKYIRKLAKNSQKN